MDPRSVSDRCPTSATARRSGRAACIALALCALGVSSAWAQQELPMKEDAGVVRLASPAAQPANAAAEKVGQAQQLASERSSRPKQPNAQKPGEFEIYVNKLQDLDLPDANRANANRSNVNRREDPPLPRDWIRRLEADQSSDDGMPIDYARNELGRQASPDYVLGSGDEVQITLWGSVDGDLRQTVDRAGRIVIPRVGPILVAGVRYGDLNDVIRTRVGQVFKNFQVSTSLGKLRNIRVYVTGFAVQPGAYTVSGLSTIASVISQAGYPSAAGSYRNIELRRNGKLAARFDYYDLLLKGDQTKDSIVQADDVVHINAVGAQVAVLGSVNKPSILELKAGETVDDVLAMAGGLSPVADSTRLTLQRLSERTERRIVQLTMPADGKQLASNGDVYRAFSAVAATLPAYKQYKRIRVEGEVALPGDYVLPPASTLADAIQAAGGLTPQAYVFGTEFTRESTRKAQQENYDRALRDLETEMTRNSSTQRAVSADEATAQATAIAGTSRLLDRLRAVRPTGRIVLQLAADTRSLPPLTIEDGDKLHIPAAPTTVGVFGSVFNAGSYLLAGSSTIDDMLKLAGGPTRGADVSSLFVLRANGSVVSSRQSGGGWLSAGSGATGIRALPGDTIFVPEELNKTTFVQEAKEWTQILYQFGIGAAALKTIRSN